MKKWESIGDSLPAAALIILLIALWEITVRTANIPEYILPAPSLIGQSLLAGAPLLMTHTRTTLTAVAVGLLLAVLISAIVAVAMNRWRWVKQALYPLLVVTQAVPIIALAPLFLIWFGWGMAPKILVVTLVCFFPMAVSLVEGLDRVDPEALQLMRVMKAGPWMTFKSVQLPAVLPFFFSGLKISATYSVMGAIIGEWLGTRAGLGLYMIRSMHSFKTGSLFAAIIIVILLSLGLFKLTELLAWLTMPWNRAGTKPYEE